MFYWIFFYFLGNWYIQLQNNYSLKKGLVDVNGEPVGEKNFEEQADMCEIVRALAASGKFPGNKYISFFPH